MEKLPPLRTDIDIVPVRHDGQDFLVVRDSLGLVAEGLALRAEIAPLLSFFDGQHTTEDLVRALKRPGGEESAGSADIEGLVAQFDELGILATERYAAARREAVSAFVASPVREAALAGSAYPAEGDALAAHIDGILASSSVPAGTGGPPAGIVAPHIDLGVGPESYGAAYGALGEETPSALLLLGTGHALAHPYGITEKTFRTPLGEVHADGSFCRALAAAGGDAVAPDDFIHRSEHSLEFQLLFLQRLYPMENVPIVPVLCGSFDPFLRDGTDPLSVPGVRAFVEKLRQWLGGKGRIAVAGVDFSHVGPKFGDVEEALSLEGEFRDFDGKLLAALEDGDREAFYEHGVTSGNCYKVCGFSALWTLLAVLPDAKGRVLDYRVWHEKATRSAVSFAAATLF